MGSVAAGGDRAALSKTAVVLGSVAVLAAAVAVGQPPTIAVASALVVAAAGAVWLARAAMKWETLIGAVVLVILFVPIKRYKFVVELPFDLELYRIVLAMVIALWVFAMLADRRVRLRRSLLDGPLLLFLGAVLGSVLTNLGRLSDSEAWIVQGAPFQREPLEGTVVKEVIFLLSFYLLFYLVVSVVRDPASINAVVKILVAGATVVAGFALVEARTGYNAFDHLRGVLPILSFEGALSEEGIARGGRLRVYASAQHPIGLANFLVMLVPFGLYLARHTAQKRWFLASAVIGLGAISTVSRTSITTMVAVIVALAILRPREMKRLWPLALPAVVAIHFVLPGAIGGIQGAFFPEQGLIQDQTVYGGRVSGERVGPEFEKIKANPLFGQGFGTRITEKTIRENARVLDNEWLGTASETGLVGFFAWICFFARIFRRAGSEARRDRTARGDLLVATVAAAAAFAVGMLTFDSFAFIQVTFVLFILAALGSCAYAARAPWPSNWQAQTDPRASRALRST
jgi:polysaccharide biosynthesis protein PslJ